MGNYIVEAFNLSKIYKLKGKSKEITALDNLNFKVKEGEKFGLLGPNGAGKTTLVSILTTIIQPTSGYALINGYNILKKPNKIKPKIALMLSSDMLYYRITGYDNLKFYCKIYQIPNYKEKINKIAEELELKSWLNQFVEHFSMGMKVKLSLCRILLLYPEILFLDEPTLRLDIKTTNFIIDKLKNFEKTIFLTTHNMNVVENLCRRIAFINKGKIIQIGSKEELRKIMRKEIKIFIQIVENKVELKNELNQVEYINEIIETKEGLIIFLKERKFYQELLKILGKYPVFKIKEADSTIEDIFLKIIQ